MSVTHQMNRPSLSYMYMNCASVHTKDMSGVGGGGTYSDMTNKKRSEHLSSVFLQAEQCSDAKF